MSQIIVATEADTGSLKKYSSSGSNVWSVNRTGGFVAVALDAAGNIVAGGARNYGSAWTSLHKYDASGTEITSGWPVDTADGVTGVDTDSSSGVYVTTSRSGSSSRTLKKYASTGGSVSWEVNIAASMWAVGVDSSDYAIFGGDTASSLTTYRYASDGTYQWGKNHHDPVYAITTDSSGNIYAAGYRTTFDFVTLYTTEKDTNVVSCKTFVQLFTEHFNTGNNCFFLLFFDTNDFDFVIDTNSTTVDTT